MLKKSPQTVLFILSVFALSIGFETAKVNDVYTGFYFVQGSKMVEFYNCPSIEICGPDEGPFIDTTRFTSVVAVKKIPEKSDTLHFFGLPGADEGEIKLYFGSHQRNDSASSLLFYDESERDRIYGSYSGNAFEIDYSLVDRFYIATGTIHNDTIEIQAQFTGRSISVIYELTGEKIYNIK